METDATTSSTVPDVSVVICSRNRPDGLRRALDSVLALAGDDVEVIVVDHSQMTLAVPIDARARTIAIGPAPRGAARAAGLRAATGRLVAYCDDVDAWQPGHLAALRAAIDTRADVAAVYGRQIWRDAQGAHAEPPETPVWPGSAQTPHIPSSAVLHRADAARRVGGFDAHVDGFAIWDLCIRMSDWWGLAQLPEVEIESRIDWLPEEFGQNGEHDRGVIARHAMGRRIRVPRHRAARSPRREPTGFDPSTWNADRRELSVRSVYGGRHSYASVNSGLLPALEREGVSIVLGSTHSAAAPEFDDYLRSPGDKRRIPLFYEVGSRPRDVGVEPLVQYTMMEQDFLPLVHAEEINRYVNLLYVPCRMCAESFRRGGVEVPIQILHHGVDAAAFPYLERPQRAVFTFGTYGQQNERKGVDVLLRAFQDEFRPHEAVRLVLNATLSGAWITTTDDRIEVRNAFLARAEILEFLRELDVMMLPSRGEGFGLCGLEAMATGLPLIATNWSGPAEYLDPDDSYPLAFELVETAGHPFGGMRLFGRWAEPSYEHLRLLMRQLFEDRAGARSAGRRASQRIHRDWTWERAARTVVQGIDSLVAGASPISDA